MIGWLDFLHFLFVKQILALWLVGLVFCIFLSLLIKFLPCDWMAWYLHYIFISKTNSRSVIGRLDFWHFFICKTKTRPVIGWLEFCNNFVYCWCSKENQYHPTWFASTFYASIFWNKILSCSPLLLHTHGMLRPFLQPEQRVCILLDHKRKHKTTNTRCFQPFIPILVPKKGDKMQLFQ